MHELEYNAADEEMALPRWVTSPARYQQVLVSTTFMLVWLITELLSKKFMTAGGVSGWYPTAGLGVALLWGLGLRYAWAVGLAALLGGLGVWEFDFLPAFMLALIKTATYTGAAIALRRILPPGRLPKRPIDVGWLIAALLSCAVLTAGAGVGALVVTGVLRVGPAGSPALNELALEAMTGWVVGDAVGLLVTAPLLVMVFAPWLCLQVCRESDQGKARYARVIGAVELFRTAVPWLLIGLVSIGLAVCALVPDQVDPRVYYLGFIALPALAMRYRLAGGLVALFAVSLFGMFAAGLGDSDLPTLTDLQLIMIALAISTILVGSFAVMRTRAEEERQAEHRWAMLAIRGSGVGRWYWEVGSDRFVTDFLLTDAFGYRRDKVVPTTGWWEQRVHPEDVRQNKREMQRLLSGEIEVFEVENRMLAADGSWGWFQSQGVVIERDAQRKPKRIAGTHHDITERKELEQIRADAEATHRSEQRFRTLADGAPVAIFQTDAKGVFLYVNPTWREITGQEQTDALYRSAAAFAHPDDRNTVADHWAAAVQSGTAMSCEHRLVTPDNRTLWLQTQATPMHHNGVLLGYVGTAVDVTYYREAMAMIKDSEARYRTFAEHASDVLWRVNAAGEFTYLSPSTATLLQYEPEELVGTNAFALFHPDDLDKGRKKFEALSPDNPEFNDVHRYKSKDGSYRVFEAVGKLIVPEDGQAPYTAGISRDVTQRVESQRIQRELEDKLARSQKLDAIGTFATGIAHDFRNSLLAIKASAQSAGRQLDDDHPAQPALATMLDACAQAMEVTQSLLTFARGQGASKRPTDLAKLLRDNRRLLQAVVPPTITLQLDCPDQPIMVKANAGELQQALLNLVVNAQQAIEGQGIIQIHLSQQDDAAVLRVADTGCGMSPDVLSRALEPFFTTRARLKGTGLGLAQVHGIVSDHAGELALNSTPGQGTTITLTLPILNNPTRKATPTPTTTETQRS